MLWEDKSSKEKNNDSRQGKVWRVPDGRGLFWDARNTSRQENSSKLLRIEMEIIHILMTMGMY